MNEREQFEAWLNGFINEHGYMPTPFDAWQALAAPQADKVPAAEGAGEFYTGVCVSLAVIYAFDQETCWREVVKTAGAGLLQHAAYVDPEEWELAGFDHYQIEKPIPATPPAKANPAAGAEPEFFAVFGRHETGWIALPVYSNETIHGVKSLVLEAARKEGYKGTAENRLLELGWKIRPVYATPPATSERDTAAGAEPEYQMRAGACTISGPREDVLHLGKIIHATSERAQREQSEKHAPAPQPARAETPINDKAHPRFIAGYEAGLHDGHLDNDKEPALEHAKLPQEAQPVAQWQKRHPARTDGEWENTHQADAKWWRDNAMGWEIRALYAAPQPARAGAVKLSDDDILEAAERVGLAKLLNPIGMQTGKVAVIGSTYMTSELLDFARAILTAATTAASARDAEDAARYRWLREPKRFLALGKEPYIGVDDGSIAPNCWGLCGQEADETIDAARNKEQGV